MTLEVLAAVVEPPLQPNRLSEIETGSRGSQTVTTLLRIIKALEDTRGRPLGKTPAERLSRFFAGPMYDDAIERRRVAERDAARMRGRLR